MDWLIHASQPQQSKINFKKLEKFTLYDQNYISEVDEEAMTFKCVLNCKRINRMYSTICTIEGDLKIGLINISCRLLDQQHIIHGQWAYQRIQLTRFAFRYNERSYRNIYIRTNPINGDVTVTLSFMTNSSIIEDDQKFREVITDLCHTVGQESQMIFNTMLQIIFGKQANEPYLKSAIKVNPGFPRYMKVEKLLDKVKTLIATSNFYKIRPDISSAHKNRSFFKKQFQKKYHTNPAITQLALAYQLKFNKKYDQVQKKTRQRSNQFIKDYIQLQQKNEIQFAKHLNEGMQQQFKQPIVITSNVEDVQIDNHIYYLVLSNNTKVPITIKQLTPQLFEHQKIILEAINIKHPNISQHYIPAKPRPQIKNWIFIQYEEQIPLRQYLNQNRKTISLSTKLHIMSQICSVMQYLHKRKIQYFITIDNVFISRGLQVKIRGFQKAYTILETSQSKKQVNQQPKYTNLIIRRKDFIKFPYLFLLQKDLDNQKCDVLSLGTCLYLILMDKFPFSQCEVEFANEEITSSEWMSHWVVETEYYLSKGGQIVKIIAHLLLKCIDVNNIENRPYVEWLLVILCEIRTSLNGLY